MTQTPSQNAQPHPDDTRYGTGGWPSPRFTLSSREEPPVLDASDLGRQVASTETELNRRFDDLELVLVELVQWLGGGALQSDKDGLPARLDGIEQMLRQAVDQSSRRFRRLRDRVGADQDTLTQLRSLLEQAARPLDLTPLAQQLEDIGDKLAALNAASDQAPDRAPHEDGDHDRAHRGLTALRHGVDAMLVRLEDMLSADPANTQGAIAAHLATMQDQLERLDATVQAATAPNDRLDRIEADLKRLLHEDSATAEALRDLSMQLAEIAARPSGGITDDGDRATA